MRRKIKNEIDFILNSSKKNNIVFMEFIDLYPELKMEEFEKFFNVYKNRNYKYTEHLKTDVGAIFDFFRRAETNKIFNIQRFFNIDTNDWDDSDYGEYFFNLRHNWNSVYDKIGAKNINLFCNIKDVPKIKIKFEGE